MALWWIAGFAAAANVIVLATVVEIGDAGDIAVAITWLTLGAPFVVLGLSYVSYMLLRWVALPVVQRSLAGFVWLGSWKRFACDVAMALTGFGWLTAAVSRSTM